MDGLHALLEVVRDGNLVAGHLRGLFHIAIGRRIATAQGDVLSTGVTWRELSVLLRDLRYDKDLVAELGADPDSLAPRDRQRFWYAAIALARPDSPEAFAQAEKLIPLVKPLGYVVGPSPTAMKPARPVAPPAPKEARKKDSGPPKKKK